MDPIKIQVDINIGERTEAFFTKLFSGITIPQEVKNVETEKKQEAPTKTAVAPASTKKPASPAPSAPAAQVASSASNTKLDITDIRKVLASKVNTHREAIKEKLNEFGVQNVTTLPTEKYSEFYTFLNSL